MNEDVIEEGAVVVEQENEEPESKELDEEESSLLECHSCRKVIDPDFDDYYTIDGDVFCDGCAFECVGCGDKCLIGDVLYCNGEPFCSECAATCELCSRNVPNDELSNIFSLNRRGTITGQYVCERCYDDNTIRCDSCNDVWNSENTNTCNCGGETICPSCYTNDGFQCSCMDEEYDEEDDDSDSSEIHAYSYKPDPIFYPEKRRGKQDLYMGVELEIDRVRSRCDLAYYLHEMSNDEELFYLKHDGSLGECSGLEIVTHPMNIGYHRNEMIWNDIIKKCKEYGAQSHNAGNCGLHVHINKDYYRNIELGMYKLMVVMTRFVDQLSIFSRRRDYGYCTRVSLEELKRIVQEDDSIMLTSECIVPALSNAVGILSDDEFREMKRFLNIYAQPLHPNILTGTYESVKPVIKKPLWRMKSLDEQEKRGKYCSINIINTNTIEIRLWRGTLKYETLMASLEMTSGMAKFCKYNSVALTEKISWKGFVDKVMSYDNPRYLKEYLERKELYGDKYVPLKYNNAPISEIMVNSDQECTEDNQI